MLIKEVISIKAEASKRSLKGLTEKAKRKLVKAAKEKRTKSMESQIRG